jgi:hypothetical protein
MSMLIHCAALLLLAAEPASAVMVHGDTGAARGAHPAAATATTAPSTNRDGFVQALDLKAQTIVINSTRFIIGPPQLALLDKRPKTDGLLTLAGVKVGMYVRYRVEKTTAGDRVVELWVMRDPQQMLGTKP